MRRITMKYALSLICLLFAGQAYSQWSRENMNSTKAGNHKALFSKNKESHAVKGRSRYIIPRAAYSVASNDIDLDGDMDIVVGHNYCFQTNWSGVSILLNDGFGCFDLYDSVYLYGWQPDVQVKDMDDESFLEIIAKKEDSELENQFMAIINDFDLANTSFFTLNTYTGFGYKSGGDIDDDGYFDVVIASNSGQFWGVLYNDGTGSLSQPDYHDVEGYFPSALACGDLNEDGRDDVVVCGQKTEVYFSYPGGFESLLLEQSDSKTGAFVEDFDFDGDNDLITFRSIPIANISVLKTYENLGGGVFDNPEYFSFNAYSVKSFLSDLNNDSLPDAIFTLLDNTGLVVYYNQGDFQLGDSSFIPLESYGQYEGARNCAFADFDGNGFNDIAITRQAQIQLPDNLVILFNDGNGNFGEDPITEINNSQKVSCRYFLSCYPNPFSEELTFEIELLDKYNNIYLNIYNLQGVLVRSWFICNKSPVINTTIKWDGTDNSKNICNPGIYVASLEVNNIAYQQIKIIKRK
ncbi:MAG: T9SS type A sorting domain-containing protein [Bacteroidales bacterium]|nr:T9SS type A sorting domain-containing protein [Bacteroidales bacterium]MCF8352177.1 T9SS type A sorting domain-containing protein [Bacteroidales bacterium]MCF8377837.1 T9SS type A sorting domain-containing protein [Bacteroidales bacterium]MCF8402203.1 T9SS type A sorting domain-containing protein [Bacteroidales bacterium]